MIWQLYHRLCDLAGVQGWLYPEEKTLLNHLSSLAQVGILEIGSWKGLSTIELAKNSKVTVYAVDPHRDSSLHRSERVKDTYRVFLRNIKRAGVSDCVSPLRMTSLEAANLPIRFDLIFIDGDHDYEPTREYYMTWGHRLEVNGVLVLHDVLNDRHDGPRKVWDEYIKSPTWERLGMVRTTGYARKLS